MKAIVYTRYGSPDVLRFQEVEQPVPKDGEVLIKVYAASLNALDRHTVRSRPLLIRMLSRNGMRRPKDQRLGVDLAGRVEAVGPHVTRFAVGDAVFGRGHGAFAEYATTPENRLAPKPANISFEQAAAVPIAALTALGALRDKGQLARGQRVLIYGAGGGVGMFAVQIAKALGADVTAVCGPENVAMVRSLGADPVIDYTQEDILKRRRKNRQRFDLILGVNGYHSIWAYRRALRRNGRYVFVGASSRRIVSALLQAMLLGPWMSRLGTKKLGVFMARPTQQDLMYLKELLEAGTIVPVIDRCYPLPQTADALRHMEEGHIQGKIVITIAADSPASQSA